MGFGEVLGFIILVGIPFYIGVRATGEFGSKRSHQNVLMSFLISFFGIGGLFILIDFIDPVEWLKNILNLLSFGAVWYFLWKIL